MLPEPNPCGDLWGVKLQLHLVPNVVPKKEQKRGRNKIL